MVPTRVQISRSIDHVCTESSTCGASFFLTTNISVHFSNIELIESKNMRCLQKAVHEITDTERRGLQRSNVSKKADEQMQPGGVLP
jgi:hypothetical protein